MKKIIISSLVVIMFLSVHQIWAQRSPSGRIDQLKTELDLSDEQVAQLEKIVESNHAEMMALKNAEDKSQEEKRAAMQSFREATHKEIEGVLDDDQIVKFREIQKERNGHRGQRKNGMGYHQKFKDGKGKELHAQIRAYKEQNIKPVMLEQRAKLEPKISDEDKQLIAELRVEFEKKRGERMARFENKGGKGKNGECQQNKGRKDCMNCTNKPSDENREKMKSLVEKYKDDIEPLFAEVADQQEKWKKDIKEITQTTLELNDDEVENGRKRMQGFHGDRWGDMKMGRFLLLDPNENSTKNLSQSKIIEVTAFPNPATSVTTLEYEVLEDGLVLIELRDTKGKLLNTIKSEVQEKGKHSLTITLENYKGDMFYLLIKDKNGVATTKNIVRVK